MSSDCIFCKIANKEITSKLLYEDDSVLAFNDLDPKAPVHVLVVPKQHIEKVSDLDEPGKEIAADLIIAANRIAKDKNLLESGYRLIINCGRDAGQAVPHIHVHVLGGRKFCWPPG